MTQDTEAVYSGGVLKPDRDLGLREQQRVRLIVETFVSWWSRAYV
jgi:predicted DNA-binding antitoxin AbrB/MazE fold protein